MFDTRWDNWAGDFAESFQATLLDPAVRHLTSDILTPFGAAVLAIDHDFPDEVSSGTFAKVMTETMPRLGLADEARPHIPEVIARFLEYLQETGRLGEGDDWAAQLRIIGKSFQERLKPNGGVKGVTIKKSSSVTSVGRNDPCPCGSGKKFKKCCLK